MRPRDQISGRCSRSATRGLVDADGGCWILLEFRRRANGTHEEIASAVWTDAMQERLSAIATEGALVGANHGFSRVGRKILVAALAIGAQL